jgi:hypothetical protein
MFKFGLNIFHFEAFDSQKSNHRALFHLAIFQEQTFERKNSDLPGYDRLRMLPNHYNKG